MDTIRYYMNQKDSRSHYTSKLKTPRTYAQQLQRCCYPWWTL